MAMQDSIIERINQPEVLDVYNEWCSRGLDTKVSSVISALPEEHRAPFELAFTTHVYKEKGLFLDLIGEELDVPREMRGVLSASADILWALSLMIDDITDGDTVRGGNETSWVKYGRAETEQSAFLVLKSLLSTIYEVTENAELVNGCSSYIQLGIRSLLEHRTMSLDTPIGILVANYENRCDFHATYQLLAYSRLLGQVLNPGKVHDLIMSLRLINQSGQLANDLKDFWQGDIYNRGFSDFKNGVPTVPLIYMYREIDAESQKELVSMFGLRSLNRTQTSYLEDIVKSSGVVGRVKARIRDNHLLALSVLERIISKKSLVWFEKWVEYKESLLAQNE